MDHATFVAECRRADRERELELKAQTKIFRQKLYRLGIGAILILAVIYFLMATPVALYQTRLIYWNSVPDASEVAIGKWTIERYVSQSDSIEYAAYVNPGEEGMPVAVYLHGRGEDHSIFKRNVTPYVSAGWTVIVPEYPGFAGLKGEPSERVINSLMMKVYQDVLARGHDPRHLLIHGNSLGAGPAMQLAQMPHGFLVLTAPVATMEQMMRHFAAYYPSFLLRDRWDNPARAQTRHRAPAMVFHSTDDLVVPVEQGRQMVDALDAEYVELNGYGHSVGNYGARIGRERFQSKILTEEFVQHERIKAAKVQP